MAAPIDDAGDKFAILPIKIPATASYPETAIHEVRVRRNAPKIPTANDSRSLFLKNIPIDSTEPHFRAVFTELVGAGRFETITFEDPTRTSSLSVDPAQATKMTALARKRKRGEVEAEEREQEAAVRLPETWTRRLQRTSSSTAVVLLADDKSVQLVLKAISKLQKTKKYPLWSAGAADVPPLGSSWISSHLQQSRVDKQDAQRAVHAFFNAFNRKEKEAAELAKRLRNEPDEDGFVTVTRGGRAAPASRTEAEEAQRRLTERDTKKKDDMKDFYRFQLRERRKAEQAALLRRFEEDRRKVNAMREKRGKFKPET